MQNYNVNSRQSLIKNFTVALIWNIVRRVDVACHVTCVNQSECIISEKSNYSTLKLLYEIGFKDLNCHLKKPKSLIVDSVTRWLDYFSILGHYNSGNSPKSIKIYQRWCKILPTTNLSFWKMPKDLQNIAILAKFRQIWSHWLLSGWFISNRMIFYLSYAKYCDSCGQTYGPCSTIVKYDTTCTYCRD